MNKTILIIEDDPDLQKIYSDKLGKSGFNVVYQNTGKGGLDRAKDKPNLIILDVMLADGMNGFDVLEALKRDPALKNIPVIILTNLTNEEETAKKIGAVEYLIKTNVTIAEVVNKVKQHALKS